MSFDHLFATYLYTSYWRVGEFLTNSDRRLSYLPKFGSNHSFFVIKDSTFLTDYYFFVKIVKTTNFFGEVVGWGGGGGVSFLI